MSKRRTDSVELTLEAVGDYWTFLILREAFFGVRRFDAVQNNLAISRNILALRLQKLVENEILKREQYQDKPPRFEYRLTEKGLDLYPIIVAMLQWGDKWQAADKKTSLLRLVHKTCGNPLSPATVCNHCGEPIKAREVTYHDYETPQDPDL